MFCFAIADIIAICVECDEVKSLNTCPVCKTETRIKRNI